PARQKNAENINRDKPENKAPIFKQLYVFPKLYWGEANFTEGNLLSYRNVIVIATNEDKRRTLSEIETGAAEISAVATSEEKEDDKDRRIFPKDPKVQANLWPIARNHRIFNALGIPSKAE